MTWARTERPDDCTDIDPSNPMNIVGSWQQDRWSNGGSRGLVAGISTDGGFTWSAPIEINQTPATVPSGNQQAFTPAIRVAADGTIGVTYYDFRNNTSDRGTPPPDHFIVHCHPSATVSCTAPGDWESEILHVHDDGRPVVPRAAGLSLGNE